MVDERALTSGGGQAVATLDTIGAMGRAANEAAARHSLADYRSRKAERTVKRQDGDLAVFAEFLAETGASVGDLSHDPEAWRGITWGLVESFVKWQLQKGYSVGTVNIRLSTVKTYCKLAMKAGTLPSTEYSLIRAVQGYNPREAKRIDESREAADIPTRKGAKKAEPVSISQEQAQELKSQPNTPQGRRDSLIMCLLLDHGLRVGELAALTVEDFDLKEGTMTFYRPKVTKEQTHKLTDDTKEVLAVYLENDALEAGPLLRGSRKDGRLHDAGMSKRAIRERVRVLGEALGIESLSPHDCRHHWATQAARSGTPIDRLKQAGGWNSLAMPDRYIKDAKIANEGVRLG